MKKKLIPILAALLLIVIVVAITLASGLIKKYSFTDERADLNAYFNLQGEDQVGLVLQDEVVEDKGKLIDGEVYLNYNTVKNYFNSRFYWDANENVLLYTTPTDIIKAEVGSKDYYISKNKNTESYAVVKAVSYTNLDVYKRQGITMPRRFSSCRTAGNIIFPRPSQSISSSLRARTGT